jgi:L1 cell adhesion molecule like protein
VTFDIDANGIMNVKAVCKSTGKTSNVTITNDSGRLSKEDIERLVKEAETFKEQDEQIRKKVESKNALENYIYSINNSMNEEKLKDKFTSDDKAKINEAKDAAQKWLESNQEAETEEFEKKLKDLEAVFNPVMTRIY